MNLKKGDKSEQVREWQEFLNKTQGESLVADGNFGGLTEKATMRFQAKHGLREDGIVGPNTYLAAAKLGFVGGGYSKPAANDGEPIKPPTANRVISARGLAFIKSFEREILRVYDDGYGFLTAGVGHLLDAEEKKRFKKGDPITKAQSDAWFAKDVEEHAEPVDRLVKVPLTQGQYDALVSLVFNIGGTNFAKSSLLADLNSGNYRMAHARFDGWVRSNGRISKGLVRRRNEEQDLFDS